MITRKKYFLHEGQFIITTIPAEIVTILGSCVSVCLWDKTLGMAGINHYLLPGNTEEDAGNPNRGYSSIRLLIKSMVNRKSCIENIEAKVFGGCNSVYKESKMFPIGQRNVEVAIQSLKEAGIHITANQTGGNCGRKIIFNTRTGKVRMRLLTKPASEIIEEINKGFNY